MVAAADREAIERVVLDYFEGWFEGDVGRMERALHLALAKRALGREVSDLDETTAQEMVEGTAAGTGKARDASDRRIEVYVDEVYEDIATARVHSAVYREYVHLARIDGEWKIVNTLWDWSEGAGPRS